MAKKLRDYLSKEDLLQEACINYLALQHGDWLVIHVPNEGKRGRFERLKASIMGMKKGVADIIVFEEEALFKGLVVELKVSPNSPTKHQADFLVKMSERGYAAAVVYDDVDLFIQCVKDWLSGKFEAYRVYRYKPGKTEGFGLDVAIASLLPKSMGTRRKAIVNSGQLFCKTIKEET